MLKSLFIIFILVEMDEAQVDTTHQTKTGGGGGSSISSGPSLGIIKTPAGLMMIVNIVSR